MDPAWASESLQVIRTLMERAAVYRRALAPVMIATGLIGAAAAGVGVQIKVERPFPFVLFWAAVCLVVMVAAFLLIRREAVRTKEAFWTPPARRVAQAFLPALMAGFVITTAITFVYRGEHLIVWWLMPLWMLFYGCGLHAAGFFMPRGIKLFGWFFILCGAAVLGRIMHSTVLPSIQAAHGVMGATFGLLHLAYGVYLNFTEKRPDVT